MSPTVIVSLPLQFIVLSSRAVYGYLEDWRFSAAQVWRSKMTVNALRGAMAHIVGCSWFVENDLKEADFSHDALEQWQEADSK